MRLTHHKDFSCATWNEKAPVNFLKECELRICWSLKNKWWHLTIPNCIQNLQISWTKLMKICCYILHHLVHNKGNVSGTNQITRLGYVSCTNQITGLGVCLHQWERQGIVPRVNRDMEFGCAKWCNAVSPTLTPTKNDIDKEPWGHLSSKIIHVLRENLVAMICQD